MSAPDPRSPPFKPQFDQLPRPFTLRVGESVTFVSTAPGAALISEGSNPCLYEIPLEEEVRESGSNVIIYAGRFVVTEGTSDLDIVTVIFRANGRMESVQDVEFFGLRKGDPFNIKAISYEDADTSHDLCLPE